MVVVDKAKALIYSCPTLTIGEVVVPAGTPWGERQPSLTVTSHDLPQTAVALVWRGPTLADRERDEAAMQVLSALLEARLQRVAGLIGGTQLFTRMVSYDKRGLWLVWGACDPMTVDAVQQAVRDEIARFIAQLWLPEADRGALPESELVAARTATAIRWALMQEDLSEVASAHATTLLLGQDLALDINRPQRFAVMGRKDILRVAQAWLTGEPVAIIAKPKVTTVVLPATTPTPAPGNTSTTGTSPPTPGTTPAPTPTKGAANATPGNTPPPAATNTPSAPLVSPLNQENPVVPAPGPSTPVPIPPAAPQPAQPVPVAPLPGAAQ
jgi:predicted Zn-dependent peptidase